MLQILPRTISSRATRQDGFYHLGETSEIGDNGTGGRDLMTVPSPVEPHRLESLAPWRANIVLHRFADHYRWHPS